MFTRVILTLGFLLLASCTPQAPVEQEKCEECPGCEQKEFVRVLILGDRTGRPDDTAFRAGLKEGARLKPDLIIGVGDLIDGYQPDERLDEAEAEWDQTLRMIRDNLGDIPLYWTAGNHDIWSDKSEGLFTKKLGHPPNFSFDVGSARVILLDSSRTKNEAEFDDETLNWLVKELYQARDRSARIVVTHYPLWAIDDGGTYGSPLHDVLIAGNADWVLTGHWHHNMSDNRDGIKYRMIGPTGAMPHRPSHPESGNLRQVGLLTIDGEETELSIVPLDSIMPGNSFSYELNQLEWNIATRALRIEGFALDHANPSLRGSFNLYVTNVTEKRLKSELTAVNKDRAWKIYPTRHNIDLRPAETRKIECRFSRSSESPLFPGPEFEIGFPWPGDGTYQLKKSIDPILINRIKRTKNPPVVDGMLDDPAWAKQPLLKVPSKTPIRALVAISGDYLYVGAESEILDHNPDQVQIALLLDVDPTDRECLRVRFAPSGEMGLEAIDTRSGATSATKSQILGDYKILRSEDKWSFEASIKIDQLKGWEYGDEILFNLGIVTDEYTDPVTWQPLLEHNIPSFGILSL